MARRTSKRTASKKTTTQLPRAELDVMSCLWQRGTATAREIREMMLRYRPMAHGSVVTLLTRLEAKNMVTKEKGPVGKAFIYKSSRKAEVVYRDLVKDMLDRVFAGDMGQMVRSLLESTTPTAEEYDEIKKAVNKTKPKGKKRR